MKNLIIVLVCLLVSFSLYADSAADVRRNLARMPRPWRAENYHVSDASENYAFGANTGSIDKLSWQRYTAALHLWDRQFAFFTLEELGRSLENDPIYLVKITDPETDDSQKIRVAIVCHHCGSEKSPLYSLMAAMEFLCSPEALKYRQRFDIRIIPCGNNWGFFRTEDFAPWNSKKIIPYAPGRGSQWDIPNLTFKLLNDSPEIATFCQFMDDFTPELLLDWHGVGRKVPGEVMQQYCGAAGSNHALRHWSERMLVAANSGAVQAGQAVSCVEEDGQRLISVAESGQAFPLRFRQGGDYFYTDMYPYVKYHTMPFMFEIGYEKMGVGALRGLLDFGLNPPADLRGNYPVDNIVFPVVSAGTTLEQRRASRLELWNQVEGFQVFVAAPQYSYRNLYVVTLGKSGIRHFFNAEDPNGTTNLYLNKHLSSERTTDGCDWKAVGEFMKLGPETNLAPLMGYFPDKTPEKVTLSHGIAFALPIQVAPQYQVEMLDVRVNGRQLAEDSRNGYTVITTATEHQLLIQVPPEKCGNADYFVISAGWTTDAPLETGWIPPAEVLEAEKNAEGLNAPAAPAAQENSASAENSTTVNSNGGWSKPANTFTYETFDQLPDGEVSIWNGVCSLEPFKAGESELIQYNDGKALQISGSGKITFRTAGNSFMLQEGDTGCLAFDLELSATGSLYMQGGKRGNPFCYICAIDGKGHLFLYEPDAAGKMSSTNTQLIVPKEQKVRLEIRILEHECICVLTLADGTQQESAPLKRKVDALNYLSIMSAEGTPGPAFTLDNFEISKQ